MITGPEFHKALEENGVTLVGWKAIRALTAETVARTQSRQSGISFPSNYLDVQLKYSRSLLSTSSAHAIFLSRRLKPRKSGEKEPRIKRNQRGKKMLLTKNEKTCAALVAVLLPCAANAAAQRPIKTLYGFTGPDGEQPTSLVLAGNAIYGATIRGGVADGGTAFELTPPASPGGAWTETTLYSFPEISVGIVLPDRFAQPGGMVYGVTQNGGAAEHGTVFQLVPPASPGGAWTETDLYVFSGGSDGGEPKTLVEQDGVLYGVTRQRRLRFRLWLWRVLLIDATGLTGRRLDRERALYFRGRQRFGRARGELHDRKERRLLRYRSSGRGARGPRHGFRSRAAVCLRRRLDRGSAL